MKVAFLTTVLALLVGVLILSLWMRKPSYEGFEGAPECIYSAVIPNRYLLGCADNLDMPFVCNTYTTFDEAIQACNQNINCRGIVKSAGPGGDIYTIRTGGEGATDYTNFDTMRRDMLGPSISESVYLITNLAQCKPNTPASTVTTVEKTEGAKFRINTAPRMATGGASAPSGAAPAPAGMGRPEFVVSGESITVPASTLVAVPAGQTIFAKRAGAGAAAGGATESTPAPVLASRIASAITTGGSTVSLTEADLTADERAGIEGLPIALGLKIVDAVRRGVPLNTTLTVDELATLRIARQGRAQAAATTPSALLTTPSLALSSQTTGTLTGADLQAIQEAAAAGAAQAIG